MVSEICSRIGKHNMPKAVQIKAYM